MKGKHLKLKDSLLKTILPVALILLSFYSCKKKTVDPRIVLDRDYKKEILAGRDALRVYLIGSETGISVSVSVDGKTVWSEGYGFANKELKAPARPETKYRIGRTSQIFPAMLIAKLQEEGKVDVNEPFSKYVPNYPAKQWDFTPYNLGTHSAGFPETDFILVQNKQDYKSLKEFIQATEKDSLLFKPNQYFAVSDYDPCLLGILAETIGQKSYPKLVKEMLLDTLGLNETELDSPSPIIDYRSTPYHRNFIAQVVNAPEIDSRFVSPAYGYLSTADDLNKLGQLLMNKEFFSEESYKLFFTPNTLDGGFQSNLGFGWNIYTDRQGRKVYIQEGSTIGGSSFLAIFPDQKLVVSICTNLADNSESVPSGKIVQLFLDKINPVKQEEPAAQKEEKAEKPAEQ
ncbi:serine hydrolase domain-containing protein [Mangrovibacterium diazotrophicum]|uniref:CubicO group peptidase (Beta-lactamase class C family) n=1 Tax=Mangrovibacterium diazotrophicum TaxID=1261403 RepID=A0A419W5I2_9BACT|nr:serine hydrolase domain-containing protein [Mangrovibacterium diazotrophicum]RKD90695.1 CubicO group peptidase (beta-lactamase class C family) [Mangrovibacterium diazotrophicum]